MSKKDYYEVLGLKKGASETEIKKAYRRLAKEFHPDRNRAEGAEDRFKEVQEAYDILGDEQKRSAYDKYGFAGTQGFGGMGGAAGDLGGFDFSNMGDLGDLFGSFFGSNFGGFGASRQQNRRGGDIQSVLKLSFDEAVFGAEKTISYYRQILCDQCNGTGAKDGKKKTCSQCEGHGQVAQLRSTIFGSVQTVAVCPRCHGTGEEIDTPCANCRGEGRFSSSEKLNIKIPPGIPDGVTLRFERSGDAGRNGGGYGDLYVTVEVAQHPRLERRGDDIYLDQEVDVVTAVLGGEVLVPSVRGNLKLKVPKGTQPGQIIKLTGKGAPKFKGGGEGDQYVRLLVNVPEKLSKEEEELWSKLRQIS